MPARRTSLRTRFLVACSLLVLTGAGASFWTLASLSRLGETIASMVRDTDETTRSTAWLATALEREDDALLLALANPERAGSALDTDRAQTDQALRQLLSLLATPGERVAGTALEHDVRAYRAVAGRVAALSGRADALLHYHREANPLLRRAVQRIAGIRDGHFEQSQLAAATARDEVRAALRVVLAIAVVAMSISVFVALRLARAMIVPLQALRQSAIAIREGDLDARARVASGDEFGEVASAFNEMAVHVAEFRRHNLSEVLEAKSMLEATLAALPDAVVLLEPDGSIATLNPEAQALFRDVGLPEPRDAQALEALGVSPERVRAALAGTPSPPRLDLRAAARVRRGKDERSLLARLLSVGSVEGGGRRVVVVISDVTELVNLDEMRAELVAVVSHELRTPVTTLRMTLMMLREAAPGLQEREREIVDTAALGIEQLAETVDELLDLTSIEAGRLRLSREPVDPRALCQDLLRRWGPRARDADIALELDVDGSPARLFADRARLRIVLDNLIDNALKYAPAHTRIGIGLAPVSPVGEGRPGVRFWVVDQGPGIPEEFRELVFEKFFRVEHYRSARGSEPRGTGVGLYLCRQLVDLHGGEIRCDTGTDGRGTRFAVDLPVGQ